MVSRRRNPWSTKLSRHQLTLRVHVKLHHLHSRCRPRNPTAPAVMAANSVIPIPMVDASIHEGLTRSFFKTSPPVRMVRRRDGMVTFHVATCGVAGLLPNLVFQTAVGPMKLELELAVAAEALQLVQDSIVGVVRVI